MTLDRLLLVASLVSSSGAVCAHTAAALVPDAPTQHVIASQVSFVVKGGLTFDPEGLAGADVDLQPLFAPYLEAFRDLSAAGRSVGA